MVYKKYIKKGGKVYGPYTYHSKRVDGKVVSEYRGPAKQFEYKKFIWVGLGIVLLVVFVLGLIIFNRGVSGGVMLDIDAKYQEGQSLDGVLRLSLREGELIPVSSKLVFESSDKKYEYALQEIVSNEMTEGDFYIEGQSISGTGLGYGKEGTSKISPKIYFTLYIYNTEKSEASTESEVIEKEPEETEEIAEEETEEGIESEEANEEESSEEAPVTGNIISRLFEGLFGTGRVVMELETEVQGEVSVDNPFVYELEPGQTVELKPKSVKTDLGGLSDNVIDLDIQENQVIVTTDYLEKEKGFGENYLGNSRETLVIDLSDLNLIVEKQLKISLVYSEEEVVSLEMPLGEKIIKDQTTEKPKEEKNKTEEISKPVEEPVEVPYLALTDEEKAILLEEFGEDFSIETIRSEVFNERLIIGYKLREYKIEYSYDYPMDEEILELQMEADRIKWLKDIAQTLLQKENVPETVEGVVESNYPIV